jgi:hypothetical protein
MKMFGVLFLCAMGFSVDASEFSKNDVLSKVKSPKQKYLVRRFYNFVGNRTEKGKVNIEKVKKDLHLLPDEVLKAYIADAQKNERIRKST